MSKATENIDYMLRKAQDETRCTYNRLAHTEGEKVVLIQPVFNGAGPTRQSIKSFVHDLQSIMKKPKLYLKVHLEDFEADAPEYDTTDYISRNNKIYAIRLMEI